MTLKKFPSPSIRKCLLRIGLAMLALGAVSCAAAGGATLKAGMTPAETIQSMGQPDLRDSVSDPNHSGATVLRYIWLEPGKAAIFGSNDRVASVQDVDTGTRQKAEQQQAQAAPWRFDPIQTPLDYLFFPVKAGLIYIGAGANCIGGGSCHRPTLPQPGAG